jgi:hypothetical protein
LQAPSPHFTTCRYPDSKCFVRITTSRTKKKLKKFNSCITEH